MAYSKPASDDALISLTDCGICLSEMENPKALPCLHSFCLKCLKKVKHPPGIINCPLCQEKITLPPQGIDGFRDNFFINQLKDRRAISKIGKMRMRCISCGATDREIGARCVDCNGFLCQQCVNLHQTIAPLKVHTVFTIIELRSGAIDMSKVMKEACCQKHKDQVLRWFCKTCGIPICRDCTVTDHRHPDHDYVTIESVIEGQVNEIKTLMANCKGLSQQVTDAIGKAERVQTNLNKAVDEVKRQLDQEKKAYLEAIERNYKANMDNLAQIQREKSEKIDAAKKGLQNMQSKLNNAMEMGNQVITTGSKHDVASNYSTLCKTLTQLQDVKPTGISKILGVVKFKPSQKGKVKTVDLGSVSVGPSPKEGDGRWITEKEIGKEGDGKIKGGLGVAVSQKKEIFIADSSDKNVKIFDSDGNYRRALQENLNQPCDVAISSDGSQYITDYTGLVHVFSPEGKNLKQFPAMSPDGKASDTDGSKLYGLAIDNDGNLLVGNSNNYISKHKPDGTHISSFKTNLRPFFITVTPQGRILVCAHQSNTDAQVLDHTGNLLHTINKPKDAKSWRPCGVCCSDDGIIYITSYDSGNQGGIYSFTEEGDYLGCVTTDVIHAEGIALIDEDRLVVVQRGDKPARIFCYEEI